MEVFSEIYSCYYQVLRHLLCSQNALTIQDIRSRICDEGFEESLLSIIPRLEDGTWNLFEKDGKLYHSRLSPSFITPVSDLEKSYLKALLSDPRIGLFLDREQLEALDKMLASVVPLWKPEQFCYFDRFADGDPYEDENYRSCFRTLLQAQKENRYVDIDYTSPVGNRVHHHYVPARLEYSVKNDKFRLLCLRPFRSADNPCGRWRRKGKPDTMSAPNADSAACPEMRHNTQASVISENRVHSGTGPEPYHYAQKNIILDKNIHSDKELDSCRNSPTDISSKANQILKSVSAGGRHECVKMSLEILNVSRIQSVRMMEKTLPSSVDLNAVIRHSYYQEPLKLRIVNRRNALERAMLHFANYEKNTTKIDDDTYECLIYYNQSMETELLIEVMSFGPMLTVVGNDRFLELLKARLRKQMAITSPGGQIL
ncbi:MAG: WYL domain-containing protein [Acetatifactor sp.]|nr:WYL domain-containing protein [Acetatifactor sp.]MDE7044089.1 WYL domain-containing protein [Acetatifactor sp.]